jgi:hypothetical protein
MKHDMLLWFSKLGCVESLLWGWNEPTTTNAPVEDEAIQAFLQMNQKPILFPCPWIFQPPSLPQNLSFLPTSPLPPTYHPSYLHHLISHSLHFKSLVELSNINPTKLHNTWLEEGEGLNIGGTLSQP